MVPLQCRNSILELAHDAPIAGHMCVTKTKDRVLAHFYWPGIYVVLNMHQLVLMKLTRC